jgi:hypothetical protein
MEQNTKARPISLEDIRYFECEGLVDDGSYHHYAEKLFHVPKLASARANRLATLCCREKVSITKRSLYLCFTPALPEGIVCPTDFRTEVWQRYVMYGLPLSFNQCNEESRVKRVWLATIESLRVIASAEQVKAIEEAASIVDAGGEDLQFSLASVKTKYYLAELAYTMPTWPSMARLLLTLTDRFSLVKSTCVLFESKLNYECGFLGGKVKIVDGNVIVSPKASSWGTHFAKQNNVSSFVVHIESLLQGAASVVSNPYEAHDT